MTFTDKHLERLKEDLNHWRVHCAANEGFLEALLARLEAAEKVIVNFASEKASPELSNAYIAWRKAAGK